MTRILAFSRGLFSSAANFTRVRSSARRRSIATVVKLAPDELELCDLALRLAVAPRLDHRGPHRLPIVLNLQGRGSSIQRFSPQ